MPSLNCPFVLKKKLAGAKDETQVSKSSNSNRRPVKRLKVCNAENLIRNKFLRMTPRQFYLKMSALEPYCRNLKTDENDKFDFLENSCRCPTVVPGGVRSVFGSSVYTVAQNSALNENSVTVAGAKKSEMDLFRPFQTSSNPVCDRSLVSLIHSAFEKGVFQNASLPTPPGLFQAVPLVVSSGTNSCELNSCGLNSRPPGLHLPTGPPGLHTAVGMLTPLASNSLLGNSSSSSSTAVPLNSAPQSLLKTNLKQQLVIATKMKMTQNEFVFRILSLMLVLVMVLSIFCLLVLLLLLAPLCLCPLVILLVALLPLLLLLLFLVNQISLLVIKNLAVTQPISTLVILTLCLTSLLVQAVLLLLILMNSFVQICPALCMGTDMLLIT